MWFPLEKWERGFLFPSRSWEDWTTSGWQNFFVIFFLLWQNDVVSQESQTLFCPSEEMFEVFFLSLIWRCCPSAKWCCPSGKSIEFFFSHSNFVLRSRKKTQWTFLQDNIILLQDNIFILRSWKKTSNISSSGQKRVWLSFETTSFCRRRKKIDKKILHPSVSQSSHDLLGNKKPLSHFSSGDHIYEGMLSFSPHAPLQYFLLPDEADFFSFLLNFKCRQWCFQQVIQLI